MSRPSEQAFHDPCAVLLCGHLPTRVLKRLVKLALSLVVFMADRVMRATQHLLAMRPKGTCVILFYHGVRIAERARFALQLDIVMETAEPISALGPKVLTDGHTYVALTFDDALQSFRDNGLPEILKRRLPIVVFVPTGFTGRTVGWAMGNDSKELGDRVLSLPELQEMARNPLVRFGSHTVNHSHLPLLNDDEAFEELAASKRFLEQALGCVVDSISFPYGAFSDRDLQLSPRAGYTTFFTISPLTVCGELGPGLLGRVAVDPTDWPLEFKLKLAGAYRWQPSMQRLRAWVCAAGRSKVED